MPVKKRKEKPKIDYASILEIFLSPKNLSESDRPLQESIAKSLISKYPQILDGCIVYDSEKYSDLKYYFSASGGELIQKGIKRVKLPSSTIDRVELSGEKFGKDKKIIKRNNILDFIKNEHNS